METVENKVNITKNQLLLGNRAVVKGLLEAKIGLAAAYPGTPSTEIQMELYRISKTGQLYFEFAVNEKVAMEIAGAAALSGVRSVAIMKHVGLNVASDALMALAYFGTKAGMVVIVVDDPGCLSSQNEQDSRLWGKFAHIPLFEPSTTQEIKDTIVKAYELSERYNMICMIRLTNFTALNTAKVEYANITEKLNWRGDFVKDIRYAIPARYLLHKDLHNKLNRIKEDSEFLEFNILKNKDAKTDKLIVTHGVVYPIVQYMCDYLKLDIPILKINAIYPLNEKQIVEILKDYKYIYFIEELESYLETEITSIIGRNNLNLRIFGKRELEIPEENRITPNVLAEAFKRITGNPTDEELFKPIIKDAKPFEQIFGREDLLIPRTLPRLCNGCPHRGAFYAIKKATKADDIIPSDIGCYALGQVLPIDIGDFWLCMGGGIGTALGFSITNDKPVVAIIGDGTFFHAGIPPLIDAVLYNHNITLAVLNNYLTAMTGGQPTPSSHEQIAKEQKQVDIEKIVRGIGVKWVKSVDVADVKANIKLFKEAMKFEGPSVMIFNGECIVEKQRREFSLGKPPYIDRDKCTMCGICYIDFSCPSIVKKDGKMAIDEDTCTACNICVNVCPSNAIIARSR
ncbi:MAG: thiamine pyrophosphate-dependent enzyme [Candidatus Heimdallarchaeaceae archaeon]